MTELEHYKKKSELLTAIEIATPCDPDITGEQIKAYEAYHEFMKLPFEEDAKEVRYLREVLALLYDSDMCSVLGDEIISVTLSLKSKWD
jgi:hypothetical protein